MQPGVVIVSNRLPVSAKKVDGKLEFYPSVGGLATGLASYTNNRHNKWIGWPGIASEDINEEEKRQIAEHLQKHNCYPVFLTKKQLDDYYNGYSNSVLWPLFHDLPVQLEHYDKWWKAYRAVNKIFADAVLHLSEPGSTVWVHDYQLLLLPELLRAERPLDTIGFFLHIPFPSTEKLQILPDAGHKALLKGVIGSDLAGFHTSSYVDNFLMACQEQNIGIISGKQVILPERVVRATEFPISIDYAKFTKATRRVAVKREVRRLKRQYKGRRVILTVDRLDPTKGLVERLKAYEKFLQQTPKLRGKVVMVMLAVPSRAEIDEYKLLKNRLEKLVTQVNKKFGNSSWQPVDYMYTSLPFEKLSALYQVADVAFIAPIRDGMNLVAKEYIASKPKLRGVLILSATAGAAEELTDALIVDPAKPKTLVDALTRAFTMPRHELRQRARRMRRHIKSHTIHGWTSSFMQSLQQPVPGAIPSTKVLTKTRRKALVSAYHRADHRLLLLDYDGVLVPFAANYAEAAPPETLHSLLEKLAADLGNEIVIISGRPRNNLEEWLGSLPISLAAEHGALVRQAGHKTWRHTTEVKTAWQKEIRPILEVYAAKTPGALVEAKEYALVWHYRAAAPYYAQKNLVILKQLLRPIVRQNQLEMRDGNKILEIRPHDISKGKASSFWLRDDLDFIMAIGDDYTDEDTFSALPSTAYTIKVGSGRTRANLRLKDPGAVRQLLKDLTH